MAIPSHSLRFFICFAAARRFTGPTVDVVGARWAEKAGDFIALRTAQLEEVQPGRLFLVRLRAGRAGYGRNGVELQ